MVDSLFLLPFCKWISFFCFHFLRCAVGMVMMNIKLRVVCASGLQPHWSRAFNEGVREQLCARQTYSARDFPALARQRQNAAAGWFCEKGQILSCQRVVRARAGALPRGGLAALWCVSVTRRERVLHLVLYEPNSICFSGPHAISYKIFDALLNHPKRRSSRIFLYIFFYFFRLCFSCSQKRFCVVRNCLFVCGSALLTE